MSPLGQSITDSGKCYKKVILSKQKPPQCMTWEEWFAKLLDFYRIHGHCKVPSTAKHHRLAKWLYRQKRRVDGPYDGRKQLSPGMIQKLQSVGVLMLNSPNGASATVVPRPKSAVVGSPTPPPLKVRKWTTSSAHDYFCKVCMLGPDDTTTELGFLLLPVSSSFADARQGIVDAEIMSDNNWMFKIPRLGLITKQQEGAFGSLLNMLKKAHPKSIASDGVTKVFITKRN